jgi:hypothetical protein
MRRTSVAPLRASAAAGCRRRIGRGVRSHRDGACATQDLSEWLRSSPYGTGIGDTDRAAYQDWRA